MEIDGTPGVAFEAGVEEAGRAPQRGALGEGQLHDILVRLTGADHSGVRPHRYPSPLPLLDHFGVGLLDENSDPSERLAPPITQLVNTWYRRVSFPSGLRCRTSLSRWVSSRFRVHRPGTLYQAPCHLKGFARVRRLACHDGTDAVSLGSFATPAGGQSRPARHRRPRASLRSLTSARMIFCSLVMAVPLRPPRSGATHPDRSAPGLSRERGVSDGGALRRARGATLNRGVRGSVFEADGSSGDASAAIKLMQRVRQTGRTAPAKIGGYRRPLLEPYTDWLRALVSDRKGITLPRSRPRWPRAASS